VKGGDNMLYSIKKINVGDVVIIVSNGGLRQATIIKICKPKNNCRRFKIQFPGSSPKGVYRTENDLICNFGQLNYLDNNKMLKFKRTFWSWFHKGYIVPVCVRMAAQATYLKLV
jgi:hypothetical protein